MEYKVIFSEKCLEDIELICEYISNTLKSYKSANRLRNMIIEGTECLSTFPEMYSRINKHDRLKREYRRIVIKNYILLYTIDYKEKRVYVSHMFYGGMNYLEGLI